MGLRGGRSLGVVRGLGMVGSRGSKGSRWQWGWGCGGSGVIRNLGDCVAYL